MGNSQVGFIIMKVFENQPTIYAYPFGILRPFAIAFFHHSSWRRIRELNTVGKIQFGVDHPSRLPLGTLPMHHFDTCVNDMWTWTSFKDISRLVLLGGNNGECSFKYVNRLPISFLQQIKIKMSQPDKNNKETKSGLYFFILSLQTNSRRSHADSSI